jgi:hypothetical protein
MKGLGGKVMAQAGKKAQNGSKIPFILRGPFFLNFRIENVGRV